MKTVETFYEKVTNANGDYDKLKNYTFNNDLKIKLSYTKVVLLSESNIKFTKRGSFMFKDK